jgi:hypothetical protein
MSHHRSAWYAIASLRRIEALKPLHRYNVKSDNERLRRFGLASPGGAADPPNAERGLSWRALS